MGQDCIFCKIAAGEIGGPPVYQDEQVTAFKDINPQAPLHLLIIPNKHSVAQALGMSTMPLMWPSTGAVPRMA